MELLNKSLNKFDKLLLYISSITIFLMMIWIFLDVILRYFFHKPITGTMELTGEYFLGIIVYLAISSTQKDNGHVNVDFFLQKISKGALRITGLISNLLGIVVFIILSINNFEKGMQYIERDIRSVGMLDYPLAPAIMMISFGLFLLCVRLLFDSIDIIRNKKEF